MIIQIVFHNTFKHQNVDNKSFQVDIDPKETISNLKTLISLKFTDLDPEYFDLKLMGKMLREEMICMDLQKLARENEIVIVTLLNTRSTCCTIF